MTSFTKPDVRKILHCRENGIGATATGNVYWKFCNVWTSGSEVRERTEPQTGIEDLNASFSQECGRIKKRTRPVDNCPQLISVLFRFRRCSDSVEYVASSLYESVPIITKRFVVKQVGDEHRGAPATTRLPGKLPLKCRRLDNNIQNNKESQLFAGHIMTNVFNASLPSVLLPSGLWLCWLGFSESIQPVKKTEWWGDGVVICLEWGAKDLHMVQLMPLPPHHLLLH